MSHLIIFIYPLLIDVILGLFIFAGPMRAVENHQSLSMISLMLTAYGVGYIFFSLSMSKIVKVKYARLQMAVASLLIALLSTVLSFSADIYVTLVVFAILPFSISLFFNAFQAFMKHVGGNKSKPLKQSVATFIFSWSIGFALGPFISGWIREYFSWSIGFMFASVLAVAVSVITFVFNPVSEGDKPAQVDNLQQPDLVLTGWAGAMTVAIVLSLFLTLFPKQSDAMGMRPGYRGMVIFFQNIVQAGVVFIYARRTRWMFNASIAPLFGLFGMGAMLCLYFTTRPAFFFFAAALLGVFGAGYFYTAVYHALSHPSKSVRNIAVNEASVGTGFFLGPQLIRLADNPQSFTQPYLYAIFILAALMVFQYIFIRRKS